MNLDSGAIILLCFLGIQFILYFASEAQNKRTKKIGEHTNRLLREATLMNGEIKMNIKINKSLYDDAVSFAVEHGLVDKDEFIDKMKKH